MSVRRYAVIVILILAAMVTPPDVISQVVLFAVIYGLLRGLDPACAAHRTQARTGRAGSRCLIRTRIWRGLPTRWSGWRHRRARADLHRGCGLYLASRSRPA